MNLLIIITLVITLVLALSYLILGILANTEHRYGRKLRILIFSYDLCYNLIIYSLSINAILIMILFVRLVSECILRLIV